MDITKYGFTWDPDYHNQREGEKAYCAKLRLIRNLSKEEFYQVCPPLGKCFYDEKISTPEIMVATSQSLCNYEYAHEELVWQSSRPFAPKMALKHRKNTTTFFGALFEVVEQWEVVVPSWDFVLHNSIPQENDEPKEITIVEQPEIKTDETTLTTLRNQLAVINFGVELGYDVYTPDYTKIQNKLGISLPIEMSKLSTNIQFDSLEDKKQIEKIDVLWLKKGIICQGWEVEGTTTIKSGLDRLNMLKIYNENCVCNIVADFTRRPEYLERKSASTFTQLNANFVSYDHIKQLAALPIINVDLLKEESFEKNLKKRLYVNLNDTYEEALDRLKKAYNK